MAIFQMGKLGSWKENKLPKVTQLEKVRHLLTSRV